MTDRSSIIRAIRTARRSLTNHVDARRAVGLSKGVLDVFQAKAGD
jgi:hypothetical protein